MGSNAPAISRSRRATHLHLERRWTERRERRASLIFPERRTGFDRRTPLFAGPVRRSIDQALRTLRDSLPALAAVLIMVNVLNILDYVFTVNALAAGMSEGNPIMDSLFSYDIRIAGLVKVLAMLGVTFVIWRNRRYRMILGCALLTLVAYLVLITYHIYGAAMFY
jgi:hypothetical protein